MDIGSICNPDVRIIRRSASVLAAARRMREEHVGDLVIVDDERERVPVGILTDRDIVVGLVAKDVPNLASVCVGDVVVGDLVTARQDEDVNDVLARMKRHAIRRVPVVDAQGQLVGILTVDDLLATFAREVRNVAELVSRQPQRERERRA
jgi:CBS domain-containing protein